MADNYYINDVDIRTYLTAVQELTGYIAAPPVLQDDFRIPGRTGATAVAPWVGARPFTIGGVIYGKAATNPTDERNRAALHDNMRAFIRLAFNGGKPVTIRRELLQGDGTVLKASAEARYAGGLDAPAHLSANAARVAVEFSLLDAYWYAAETTDSGARDDFMFSIKVPGDVPTHRVTVRFNNSATTQRLTSTTTGDWVQYDASTMAQSVLLDVADFTALQGTTNRIEHVTSGDTGSSYYWMTLAPGINTFILTGGGSVRVTYRAAYL